MNGVAPTQLRRQSGLVNRTLPDHPTGRVREALEAVYRIFNRPPPATIEGCPCCIDTRNTDVLLTTPLRKISGQALWRYVSGAFLTVGGEADFRYLMPRIFEVSVSDPANANDPEIVLGKLTLADWRSWARDEQAAVEAFIDAWFEQALAGDLANADEGWIAGDAESVMCGAARAGLPLTRLLSRLAQPEALPVVAEMREGFSRKPSGFWEDAPTAFREVRELLDQGRV